MCVLICIDKLLPETVQDFDSIEFTSCYADKHPPECGPVDHVGFLRWVVPGMDSVPLLDSNVWVLEGLRFVALSLPLGEFSGFDNVPPFFSGGDIIVVLSRVQFITERVQVFGVFFFVRW